MSCSNLAQLSNYQSFDDINLITIHHNSENYISDNIEFHKANCCSISNCHNGSICGNENFSCSDKQSDLESRSKIDKKLNKLDTNLDTEFNANTKFEQNRTATTFNKTTSFDKTNDKTLTKHQLSFSGTSTPTSFLSRFRSASPNPVDSVSESIKEEDKQKTSENYHLPLNSIKSTSCSTFLPKRPHSSLNFSETSSSKRIQYKKAETFSVSEEDLLQTTNSEQQSISNFNCTPQSKRRDSFLLKLLKKRKSTERSPFEKNPFDKVALTNYEYYKYYNHSLDEDYENSVSQNVSVF